MILHEIVWKEYSLERVYGGRGYTIKLLPLDGRGEGGGV